MSVFDLTPPAAYLSAIKAANDKDRQNARLLLEQRAETQPKRRHARITAILNWACRIIGGSCSPSGMRSKVHQVAAAAAYYGEHL